MREALFIKKHKEKWLQAQDAAPTDPDEMADHFTELVNDLAYAKTFYHTSKVTQYINGQASKIYLSIYRNRKEESNRIVNFWTIDLPSTIRKYHRVIFFMFILFCLFFVVGFFSTRQDENFARQVLDTYGDPYVDRTIENIESGNPFGVYQHGSSFLIWMGIMINNIKVALVYFSEGILFGVFTVRDLIREGVRLGAFYYIFFSRGLGLQWVLAVLIHGMLELWCIILSGAAGVIFGMGFLFPGTAKRIDSLKRAVKDGLKITIGILPLLALAAFFEGFVTRHYRMHWIFSSSILFCSATFIIWYFIIYPIRLQKKSLSQTTIEAQA